jgi:alpha-ketoglutarate-dependent 2,4-dichlorophenoxyacetate dioxygenase
MRQAYADLPEDMKTLIDGKIVERWIWHSRELAALEEFVLGNLLKRWCLVDI